MVLLLLNSGFPGPPEPSLKGRLHHSAATHKAASPGPSGRVDSCACASLAPPPFPAFSQAGATPSNASLSCEAMRSSGPVRRH